MRRRECVPRNMAATGARVVSLYVPFQSRFKPLFHVTNFETYTVSEPP